MRTPIVNAVIYGVALYFVLNVILFLVALAFGSGEKAPPPLGFALVSLLVAVPSYFFSRRMRPSSKKQALLWGLLWAGMSLLFLTVVVIGNGTQKVVFGNWGAYLMFVGIALGSLFVRIRQASLTDTQRHS